MEPAAFPPRLRRRDLLVGALGTWAFARPLAAAQAPTGWVLPRLAAPPIAVTGADGRARTLPELLAGRVSAVQLMFTGCSSSCPPQGALFAALAERQGANDVRLLSISIDALGDSPARLAAWQARFGSSPAWATAVPQVADVDRLAGFMRGSAGKPGTHTAQVFVFDAQARLCYRTGDAPAVGEVEALVTRVRQG